VIRDDLARLIAQAIKKAQRKGDLPKFDVPEIVLEHPKQAGHGDYATPVCLQMARLARMAPVEIAKQVVKRLPETEAVGQVEIAHPGYINITLSESWLAH